MRGIFGFGAIGNYFFAVSLLPLNDALVLSFSAPIWASVLGPYFLGEQSTKWALVLLLLLLLMHIIQAMPPCLCACSGPLLPGRAEHKVGLHCCCYTDAAAAVTACCSPTTTLHMCL